MTKKSDEQSFLNESQQAGKACGKNAIDNLDDAINSVTHIIDEDSVKFFQDKEEEDFPTAELAYYCHDCRDIVPISLEQGRRGKMKIICQKCGSKKISRGREEALRKFYHLEKKSFTNEEPQKK